MLTCCSCLAARHVLLSKHPTSNLSATPSSIPTNLNSVTKQSNILLSSYSNSKTIDQTLQLFRLLTTRDTVTWNTIISACSRHHHFSTSLNLFLDMLISGSYQPDTITFRLVLKACVETNNYPLALQIHAYMIKLLDTNFPDLITCTFLINLYSEFGSIKSARQIFEKISHRDVTAFTSMITCYTKAGNYDEALRMFETMIQTANVAPNEFSFTCVLTAVAGLCSIFEGKQIHAHIVKAWLLRSNVYVGTALISMYTNCDCMDSAKKAFSEISKPNVVSWNAIMAGKFSVEEVLGFFSTMRDSGLSPDHVTFATVLRACRDASLSLAKQMHGLIVKTTGAVVDLFIGSALFEIYVDQCCVSDAEKVFNGIRGKDIMAFNLAIQGYMRNGHTAKAVSLFYEALQMGMQPNEMTLTSLLVRIGGLYQAKQLHALVTKLGFHGTCSGDGSIASSLVTMYTEFHCLDDAIRVFNQIHSPDLALWTSMISSFSRSGESQEALKLYILMLLKGLAEPPNHYTFSTVLSSCTSLATVEEGKQIHAQIVKSNPNVGSDVFVNSALVDMYAKSGCITEARILFDNMPGRDIATWNAMITGLAQHGYAQTAIETFLELQKTPTVEPNHITFVGVLSACSHSGLVEEGYRYFKQIEKPTIDHYTCLIDLLGRAGRLEEALNIIKEMPYDPNEIIWSSLLGASVTHRNIDMGEYSANHLWKLNPKDPGTYIALSNIYAAAGRWEDVNKIRKLMKVQGLKKNPGLSCLSVNGRTNIFLAAKEWQN